jgi:HAD superfamily hydrolase (TIGR01493 family)
LAGCTGAELDDAAIGQLGATMRALPARPEVPAALAALRARGHRLVVLGNSPAAVVAAQLEHAGLAAVFDATYSAEAVEALKSAPAAYRFVMEAERVAPTGAVMVAAHYWDIAGAQAVGMRTIYVARVPARRCRPGRTRIGSPRTSPRPPPPICRRSGGQASREPGAAGSDEIVLRLRGQPDPSWLADGGPLRPDDLSRRIHDGPAASLDYRTLVR